jgi:hypothetical protein
MTARATSPRTTIRHGGRSRGVGTTLNAVLAALVVAAVAIGSWSLLTALTERRVGAGPAITLPGGSIAVERVRPEALDHNPGMPAGMMADPLASGRRRVTVDVVLRASPAEALEYDARMFSLRTRRGAGELARDQLGAGSAPPGSVVRASLTFVVPEDRGGLLLEVEGGSGAVRLDESPRPGRGHDH